MYNNLPKPFLVLAPMDDVTDTVFRRIVGRCAPPDLYFTEFVNVDGLQSPGRSKLLPKLQFTPAERPLVAQIWGKQPENYYKTVRQLVDGTLCRELAAHNGEDISNLHFAGVDINMGCPVKTVVRNGCCSALISDRVRAGEIIAAVKEAAGQDLPVSVKTRLGQKEIDYSWPTFLLDQKLNMLTIHGRTAREMSKVPAHWGAIGRIRQLRDELAPSTLLVGNGDVLSRAQAVALAAEHGLDGIMIGRGVFNDPFVFAKSSPWGKYTRAQKINLYRQHVELFAATWQSFERRLPTLNKFCKIYIHGFDGAKELRDQLMAAQSVSELLRLLQ